MSNPQTRSRTAAAIAGIALAAASAGIAGLDTNSRSSSPATTPAAAVAPAPVAPAASGSPAGAAAGTGLAAPAALIFPDPTIHPGATNPSLGMAQLCAAGFRTTTVRPPTSYTDQLKNLELSDGGTITGPSGTTYTVVGEHLPGAVSDYELDHLISLEIGGNPEDPRNLWMQPWERKGAKLAPAGQGAESKDVVENRLHREVCAGTLTLADAQSEVAANWQTAK